VTSPDASLGAPVPGIPEVLARTLRHEIGDFLQKVYASVAILQGRLPPAATLERDVLARLKGGAEACKHLIDAVQDYLCPLSLEVGPLDLAGLTAVLVTTFREQHPHLEIKAEVSGPAAVRADAQRLAQVGEALLKNACAAARHRVTVRTATGPAGDVEWAVTDDGPGVSSELAGRLFSPFFTTRAGHAGLGLALTRKLVLLHGGRIRAGNVAEGGFRAQVFLPMAASEAQPQVPGPETT
jgi:signal transduction histidine kinase